jgi:hypothetical protein
VATPSHQNQTEDTFAEARKPRNENLHLDKSLFQPFDLGDIKKIQSTPNHLVRKFLSYTFYSHLLKKTQSQEDMLVYYSQPPLKREFCMMYLKT